MEIKKATETKFAQIIFTEDEKKRLRDKALKNLGSALKAYFANMHNHEKK